MGSKISNWFLTFLLHTFFHSILAASHEANACLLLWQSLSFAMSSAEETLQPIYSLFDPIRPLSTFISTALGNMGVYAYVF